MVNWNFDKKYIHIEDDKHSYMGNRKFSLKLIVSMTNEALKLVQSKQGYDLIIPSIL